MADLIIRLKRSCIGHEALEYYLLERLFTTNNILIKCAFLKSQKKVSK